MRPSLCACLVALCAALAWQCARAHDLITVESAEQFLAQIQREQQMLGSNASATVRAQSSVTLGRLLDEIKDLLNRDIASHGQPQGLATLYLIQALRERGLGLEVSPRLRRYPANVAFYRAALQLDARGPVATEARVRLLQGYFYDSFDQDPLKPRDQTRAQLEEQIQHGETLVRHPLPEPEGEEVRFILAIHYLQAAAVAPDAGARSAYAARARESIAQFKARYPDSLRVAALDVLGESVSR